MKRVTFNLSDKDFAALKSMASYMGVRSMTAAIGRLIAWGEIRAIQLRQDHLKREREVVEADLARADRLNRDHSGRDPLDPGWVEAETEAYAISVGKRLVQDRVKRRLKKEGSIDREYREILAEQAGEPIMEEEQQEEDSAVSQPVAELEQPRPKASNAKALAFLEDRARAAGRSSPGPELEDAEGEL